MRVLIIIQARMGSERLPQKVMKEVLNRPLLSFLLERVKRVPQTEIVVATTQLPEDDLIVDLCRREGVNFYRGSATDVLQRYYEAALAFKGDVIVRITGDCPCIDPEIIRQVIDFYLKNSFDYVSNTLEETFPRGMDVEVFSFKVLEKAYHEAKLEAEKEHVTLYIYTHPEQFTLGNFRREENASQYRLTVDTPEDFALIKRIIEGLYPKQFTLSDIVRLLEKNQDWMKLNAHVKQKKV